MVLPSLQHFTYWISCVSSHIVTIEDSDSYIGPNFESSFAKICGLLPSILPDPNTEQAQADMAAYLLEIISPFLEKKHLKDVKKILGSAVKEFSEFGNMLLLEPTSWKWDYTHQKSSEDYIVIFSGFHQVRDELGAPTKGQHILDAQVFRLDWKSTAHWAARILGKCQDGWMDYNWLNVICLLLRPPEQINYVYILTRLVNCLMPLLSIIILSFH